MVGPVMAFIGQKTGIGIASKADALASEVVQSARLRRRPAMEARPRPLGPRRFAGEK